MCRARAPLRAASAFVGRFSGLGALCAHTVRTRLRFEEQLAAGVALAFGATLATQVF